MKRTLSLILSILMLASAFSICISALEPQEDHLAFMDDKTYTAGDVNDDGKVNALDSNVLISDVIGKEVIMNTDAADLNADGVPNARDNLILKAIFSGVASVEDYTSENPVYKLTVGSNPITDFDISVPVGTNGQKNNVYLAAQILQTYIKTATGYNIAIINGESAKAHTICFHAITPNSEESEEMGLGLEDYIYEVKDGDLHIYGTLRGNMYAAYEICEKYLGYRFYDNRYTYSYRMRTSDLPEGLYEYHKVPLEFRFSGDPVNDQGKIYQYYYARRMNGTQIYSYGGSNDGYQTGPRFINAHSFGVYKAMTAGSFIEGDTRPLRKRLNDKYIDGLSKIDGHYIAYNWQPCTTDNTAYYEMYNGMLEVLEMIQDWGHIYSKEIENLGIYSMSFSINDNGNYCTCTTCNAKANGLKMKTRKNTLDQLKYYSGDYTVTTEGRTDYVTFKKEGYSGLYMDFAVRAAKEVTTEYHGYDYEFEDFPPIEEGVRKVYPNLNLYLIIYDHTIPESIKPASNIILMYCGHGCNNHILGTGDCGDKLTVLKGSNTLNEVSMPAWADYCHEAGGSIWYWSYGVNYSYYLAPCPNILDYYYNMKYIYDVCHFDGVYYESCGGPHNNFEDMKAYIATEMMWDPEMTYEQFTDMMKEYMYMYYGDGYEYIYDYMLLQTAAGDATNWCFVNNHDRPYDMYSADYLSEHYEEMRNDILTAIDMAGDSYHRTNCERLLPACEFMGLCSTYDEKYVNGSASEREEYTKRYTDMYNYLADKENNIPIYPEDEGIYSLPDEIDLSENPMEQFYGFGSWHEYYHVS